MYFVTALQQRNSDIKQATLEMLRSATSSASLSPEPLPLAAFLTPLLNELSQLQTELILVLDDYHQELRT